jgi:F5/8 type C domain-containing protein
MEKFSRKEKIALVVFGVILLAIIIQMVWRLGEFDSPSGSRVIVDETDVILTDNLLKPGEVKLTASSHNKNNQVVDKLIDGNRGSYWHVAPECIGEPSLVTFDFGEGNEKSVRSLAALPRTDIPRQFFRKAELFGSEDGKDWQLVSNIIQGTSPNSATWRQWKFDNDQVYRYYQFLITDGHEGGKFYSMAELALFE